MKNIRLLDDGALRRIQASDEERIAYIQRDRFFSHRAAEGVWDLMMDFVERPRTLRPPCLAIAGDAGAGKSSLLKNFRRAMDKKDEQGPTRTCVFMEVQAAASIGNLQANLMAALGIPRKLASVRQLQEADTLIANAMRELGVRILLVDEIQHLGWKTTQHLRLCWDWIKWISTACEISVVCAGVLGYERYLHQEPQLKTRFTLVTMPRWEVGAALEEFLTAFERTLPLRKASNLGRREMQKFILDETVAFDGIPGITGGIKKVLEFAAIHAIRSGDECITPPAITARRVALGSLVNG